MDRWFPPRKWLFVFTAAVLAHGLRCQLVAGGERDTLALHAPAWMQPFDVNGDNQIAFSEWPASRRYEFASHDTNGDGFLCVEEVRTSREDILSRFVEKAPPSPLPKEFARMDLDGDGQLGMYEWNPRNYDSFLTLDVDNDGFLTPGELGPTPRQLLSRFKARQVETAKTLFSGRASVAFRHADRDGDGKLDEVEWRDARLKKHVAYTPPFPVTTDKFLAAYMASNPHE